MLTDVRLWWAKHLCAVRQSALILLFAAWRPLPAVVAGGRSQAVAAIRSLSAFGWLLVFATFLSDISKRSGARNGAELCGPAASAIPLRTPGSIA